MNKELELGKYEFHPNEKDYFPTDRGSRLESLIEELIYELRRLRSKRELTPDYTDDELEQGYKAMAKEEADNPDIYEWKDD